MQRSALCRSRRELSNDPNSNEYLLAKFGFDTAENELSKVCRSKQAILTPGHKSGSFWKVIRSAKEAPQERGRPTRAEHLVRTPGAEREAHELVVQAVHLWIDSLGSN